jgi:tetratricopeptide (TPR) repeat protein
MTKLAFKAAALAAVLFGTSPTAASIMVLGTSPGRDCYEAALARSSSVAAVRLCNDALASGSMSFDDVIATHVNRGIVELHAARYDAAIADFNRAIELKPAEPESYLNKGWALLRMGASASAAIPLFDEALKRQTRWPERAYYARAIAHEVSGDVQKAYQDYRRAQRSAPKWDEPQRELTRFKVVRASGTL